MLKPSGGVLQKIFNPAKKPMAAPTAMTGAAPKKKPGFFGKLGGALAAPAKMAHKATMGTAKAAHKITKKVTPGI